MKEWAFELNLCRVSFGLVTIHRRDKYVSEHALLGAGSGKTVYRVHRLETSAWRKFNVFNGVETATKFDHNFVEGANEARPLSTKGLST